MTGRIWRSAKQRRHRDEKIFIDLLDFFNGGLLSASGMGGGRGRSEKYAITYQYIDGDTGEILKKKNLLTDKQAGKACKPHREWEENYGLEKRKWCKERIDGDSGTAYMFDLGHSKKCVER